MTRCTNCKTKWKAKDTWSLLMQNDGKDCPYCFGRQYLSDDTFKFGAHALPFLFLFPFFVELNDTSPLVKFRKK